MGARVASPLSVQPPSPKAFGLQSGKHRLAVVLSDPTRARHDALVLPGCNGTAPHLSYRSCSVLGTSRPVDLTGNAQCSALIVRLCGDHGLWGKRPRYQAHYECELHSTFRQRYSHLTSFFSPLGTPAHDGVRPAISASVEFLSALLRRSPRPLGLLSTSPLHQKSPPLSWRRARGVVLVQELLAQELLAQELLAQKLLASARCCCCAAAGFEPPPLG